MKQFRKRVLPLIAFVMITLTSGAQNFNLAMNYNTAMPVSSSFREYVSNTSFRGFQAAILYNINNKLRAGLQVSYNGFYQKYGRQLYKTTDGADISTVLSNTLQHVPVLVKGEYSFLKSGWIKPYVGLGAGINLISYDQFYGEFEYSRSYAKPIFIGDLGVLIPISRTSQYGIRVSTSYNLTPLDKEDIKTLATWNVQAGIVVPLK